MKDTNDFYVYVYLDPRRPGVFTYKQVSFGFEPFYVGKGRKGRAKDHLHPSNLTKKSHKNHKIRSILNDGVEPKIIYLQEGVGEQDAHEMEIDVIALIGRRDLNTGPLTNLTAGGEGQTGANFSKETRDKMAASRRGKFHSQETKNKIKNRLQGRAPTARQIEANKNKKISPVHKEQIRVARLGSKLLPWDEFISFIRSSGVTTPKQWRDYIKSNILPLGCPRRPDKVYTNSGNWKSWPDTLRDGIDLRKIKHKTNTQSPIRTTA